MVLIKQDLHGNISHVLMFLV